MRGINEQNSRLLERKAEIARYAAGEIINGEVNSFVSHNVLVAEYTRSYNMSVGELEHRSNQFNSTCFKENNAGI